MDSRTDPNLLNALCWLQGGGAGGFESVLLDSNLTNLVSWFCFLAGP